MRRRSAIWVAQEKVDLVFAWASGYRAALDDQGLRVDDGEHPFDAFHGYVAYRLGRLGSWGQMCPRLIRWAAGETSGEEIDLFNRLLDDYLATRPRFLGRLVLGPENRREPGQAGFRSCGGGEVAPPFALELYRFHPAEFLVLFSIDRRGEVSPCEVFASLDAARSCALDRYGAPPGTWKEQLFEDPLSRP